MFLKSSLVSMRIWNISFCFCFVLIFFVLFLFVCLFLFLLYSLLLFCVVRVCGGLWVGCVCGWGMCVCVCLYVNEINTVSSEHNKMKLLCLFSFLFFSFFFFFFAKQPPRLNKLVKSYLVSQWTEEWWLPWSLLERTTWCPCCWNSHWKIIQKKILLKITLKQHLCYSGMRKTAKGWNGLCQLFGDHFMFFEYFSSIFL